MTSSIRPRSIALIDADADEHLIFEWAIQDLAVQVSCQYFSDCSQFLAELAGGQYPVPDFLFFSCGIPTISTGQQLSELRGQPELLRTALLIYSGISASHLYTDLLSQYRCALFAKCGSVSELSGQLRLLLDQASGWQGTPDFGGSMPGALGGQA